MEQINNTLTIDISVEDQNEIDMNLQESEQVDISAEKVIKAGSGVSDYYNGEYKVIPSESSKILKTKDKVMKRDVTVFGIPTYEMSNKFGFTFIIGD